MLIEKKFEDLFANVTSRAALSSYFLIGKNDKSAADKAAVDSMRNELNKIEMDGKIVIGEGELDEAPMLYICLLYTSPSPRDRTRSRMPSSA